MQDSTTVTAEGRMHREIAVRCRDAQRVGGRAEYTYMDLRGTPTATMGQRQQHLLPSSRLSRKRLQRL